jgi:siroheme synthase (precorrin-2 oxidase/ferrochelatase)
MTVTLKQVKEALGHSVDQVSKLKNGNVMVRKGYFYRNGMDDVKFNNIVANALQKNGIPVNVIDFGDHWAAFNGGATVARSSHFYVELAVA